MKKLFPKFSNRKKYYIKDKYREYGLEIGEAMEGLLQDGILKLWNGVGAFGKWYNFLIPKNIWGLNYEICSADHDCSYNFYMTRLDRLRIDRRFRRNLIEWVDLHTEKDTWLYNARMRGVEAIYLSVRIGGGNL